MTLQTPRFPGIRKRWKQGKTSDSTYVSADVSHKSTNECGSLGNVHVHDVQVRKLGVLNHLLWRQRIAVEFQRDGAAVGHVEVLPAGVDNFGERRGLRCLMLARLLALSG